MSAGSPQRISHRRALLIAWTTVVVVVGFLLYLMWEWYADPDALWQHLVWSLIYVLTPVWVFGYLIYKLIRGYMARETAQEDWRQRDSE